MEIEPGSKESYEAIEAGCVGAFCSKYDYLFKNQRISSNVTELVPLPKVHEKPIIRLSREEYQALCPEMTREDLQWCIDYVDELAQSTGNKHQNGTVDHLICMQNRVCCRDHAGEKDRNAEIGHNLI